jgi:hypothetical protein
MPVSDTAKLIQSRPSSVSRLIFNEITPCSVNLLALLSRLKRPCLILVVSAWMELTESRQSISKVFEFFSTKVCFYCHHILDHGFDREGLQIDVQDVIYQAKKVFASAIDTVKVSLKFFVLQVCRIFLEHLAVADDGVQGGAQFVANIGQKLALGAVGFFCVFFGLLCLFNEPGVADRYRGAVGKLLKELNLPLCEFVGLPVHDVQNPISLFADDDGHRHPSAQA